MKKRVFLLALGLFYGLNSVQGAAMMLRMAGRPLTVPLMRRVAVVKAPEQMNQAQWKKHIQGYMLSRVGIAKVLGSRSVQEWRLWYLKSCQTLDVILADLQECNLNRLQDIIMYDITLLTKEITRRIGLDNFWKNLKSWQQYVDFHRGKNTRYFLMSDIRNGGISQKNWDIEYGSLIKDVKKMKIAQSRNKKYSYKTPTQVLSKTKYTLPVFQQACTDLATCIDKLRSGCVAVKINDQVPGLGLLANYKFPCIVEEKDFLPEVSLNQGAQDEKKPELLATPSKPEFVSRADKWIKFRAEKVKKLKAKKLQAATQAAASAAAANQGCVVS